MPPLNSANGTVIYCRLQWPHKYYIFLPGRLHCSACVRATEPTTQSLDEAVCHAGKAILIVNVRFLGCIISSAIGYRRPLTFEVTGSIDGCRLERHTSQSQSGRRHSPAYTLLNTKLIFFIATEALYITVMKTTVTNASCARTLLLSHETHKVVLLKFRMTLS